MWIFNSSNGDPMLLDTEEGLRAFYSRFNAFLASSASEVAFPAETRGDPSPYTEFLGGLRVRKVEANEAALPAETRGDSSPDTEFPCLLRVRKLEANAELHLTEDRWLELWGQLEDLRQFAEKLLVTEEQGHRHYYSAPVSLILEADNHWPVELWKP